MRMTRYLLNTMKEVPREAETVSHQLMLRACMIKKLAAGIYTYMPLGYRVIRKIETIIREELDREGCIELLMPAVQPAEIWKESQRWDFYGKELLRFEDRKGGDFCMGPTHEEVITDVVRRELKSYRQLPLNLYQIQDKFRDEIRPRYGLMRGREFIMKDAYSFDVDDKASEESYWSMYHAYTRIFQRCGLKFRPVEADSGAIGGNYTHEFHVLADSGEDTVLSCSHCDYTANIEKAECRIVTHTETEDPGDLERVETPDQKSVEDVAAFLKTTPDRLIKTMIFLVDEDSVVAVLVRGDHEVNETKVRNYLGANILEMADDETILKATGGPSGFSGPVSLKLRMIADHAVKGMRNVVTGGNQKDLHLVNVNPGRDFEITEYADLRMAAESEPCARCDDGTYAQFKGIEVGQVFKLGTKYSVSMGCSFLDEDGKDKPAVMGCYGIGVGRTAAAAIEQNHDEYGIVWPVSIAPFDIGLVNLDVKADDVVEMSDRLYMDLKDAGMDVLFDDRDMRAGFKFKDADLVGLPIQVIVGRRGLEEGVVELKVRRTGDRMKVTPAEVVSTATSLLADLRREEEKQR